jgi:multimeric flavodoxin WrbA
MQYKVLGISGSPVKKGNVETFLQRMIEIASGKGLDSEVINILR